MFQNPSLVRRVLRDLRKKGRNISGKDVVSRIPGMTDEDLYSLIENGILTPVGVSNEIGSHLFSVSSTQIPLTLFQLPFVERPHDLVTVVATTPFEQDHVVKGLRSLYAEICRLIIGAEREIAIVNPFFDLEGRRKIIPYLLGAIKEGVKTRIVSRPSIRGRLKTQADVFMEPILDSKLGNADVRYFRTANSSVHAKLLIADAKIAYVGSANLTGRSLSSNFEVGVILTGPCVVTFRSLFEQLWSISEL